MTETIRAQYEIETIRQPIQPPPPSAVETIGGVVLPFIMFGGMAHGGENLVTFGSNVDPSSYGHAIEALSTTNTLAYEQRH